MPRVVLTSFAQADLAQILEYVFEESPAGAKVVLDALEQTCSLLEDYPSLGVRYERLSRPVRRIGLTGLNNYLLFYDHSVDTGILYVIGLLHGKRDVASELRDRFVQ